MHCTLTAYSPPSSVTSSKINKTSERLSKTSCFVMPSPTTSKPKPNCIFRNKYRKNVVVCQSMVASTFASDHF